MTGLKSFITNTVYSFSLFYDDDNNGKHNVWPEEKTILLPLYDYIYTMEQRSIRASYSTP